MATTMTSTSREPTLDQYLQDHPTSEGFTPGPQYFKTGDFINCFFEDSMCYAQRIDDLLTIYSAHETGEMVGFKIKGVKGLAKNVMSLIDIEDDDIKINLLFLSAAGCSTAKHKYYELGRQTRGMSVKKKELVPC